MLAGRTRFLASGGQRKMASTRSCSIGRIGGWNGSGLFFGFKGAAALATGCTFIYRGSENSPIEIL
jgi:acyl-CoA reductase-like NAD-dependent aldehyde dehydrogenase